MSDVVEFILKLKDMMSGGMRSVAATTQTSFARVDNTIAQTQRKMDGLARPVKLTVDTTGLQNAHREVDQLEQKMSRKGGLMSMLGSATGIAAAVGTAALVGASSFSIGEALKGSQQKASFEVLAGQQQGGKLYSDITKFAQDSIFGNELYKNAQTLLAFGIDAKKIMPDMKMLGDISMGDAEKLGSLTLAFAQTQSAGKLMGQDLLQYINAGFNPLKEISDMTGESMATLKDKMSAGTISAAQVGAAFEHATGPLGKFFQMTDKIADTPFGKWEALKGQVQGLALQFGTQLLPAVSKVLDVLPPLLTAITPMLTRLVPIFSSLANITMTLLVPALKVAGALLNTVLDIVGPVLKGVEYIVEKVFSLFDDGRIENAYQDAGELSGKSYVGGVAQEVKNVKDVVTTPITDSKVSQAYKDAAEDHGKSYMDALKSKMETFDLTVPITFVPNVRNGLSGAIGNMMVDGSGNLVWDSPKKQDVKDTPHGKSLFNAYFGTGNFPFVPNKNLSLGSSWGQSYTPKQKKIAEEAIRLAPSMLNYYGAGVASPASAKTAASEIEKITGTPGSGSDASSKALQSGGLRSIVFNIDNVGVKGGLTVHAETLKEGMDEIETIVTEAMNRVMDKVNAPLTN